MTWSLSEFLNLFEFRSQSWCFVDMGSGSGLRAPHGDVAFFHAVLEGSLRLTGVGGGTVELQRGDIAMVLSGEAHALRLSSGDRPIGIPLLENGEAVDSPPTFFLGDAPVAARLLSARLKVRWPGGRAPRRIPPLLRSSMNEGLIAFDRLIPACRSAGGASLLTRMATMVFVNAFRADPSCQDLFNAAASDDPVARALRFIEMHPFHRWTVDILARKVGMSRSSFAARFASQTGMTPMEALTAQRMRHAAELLEKTGLKVCEIAERVGYASEAGFHHRFTAHFGLPPGQWRRQQQED